MRKQEASTSVLPRTSAGHHQESKTHRSQVRPEFDYIILLLQGGGALGAYQAGVYEALAAADLHPDWVAGISIGSINAAIIAGNPPNLRVEKLRKFWNGITRQPFDFTGGELGTLERYVLPKRLCVTHTVKRLMAA
jgi:predicted acylesterase/phospholipase RssA